MRSQGLHRIRLTQPWSMIQTSKSGFKSRLAWRRFGLFIRGKICLSMVCRLAAQPKKKFDLYETQGWHRRSCSRIPLSSERRGNRGSVVGTNAASGARRATSSGASLSHFHHIMQRQIFLGQKGLGNVRQYDCSFCSRYLRRFVIA